MLQHYSPIRMAAQRAALDSISTPLPIAGTPVKPGRILNEGILVQMRATGGHCTARPPLPMQSSGLEACVEGLEEPGRHFAATLYRC